MGLILQAAPSSASASKPPMRLPKARMSKVSSVASMKPPVRSIARPPSSVVSLLTVSAPYCPKTSPAKSKPSTPAAVCVKLPVMASGASVAICSGPMLITVPLPPSTEMSSPSAVLPPAKVRLPLPIVIVPPVQDPNVLPVAASDGHVRLIIDLDIADDLAAVGYRPDRGMLAGTIDGVALRAPLGEPFRPSPPSIVPLLTSGPMAPAFHIPAPPAPPEPKPAPPFPPLISRCWSASRSRRSCDPRAARPLEKPAPPLIVPPVAFTREPIAAPLAFDTPAALLKPEPPLILPLLVSMTIAPEL